MKEPRSFDTSRAWSWRHAVAKSGLPAITRLVLHTLGLHMDSTGGSCYPSISDLVDETGLDKKTVLKHLGIAEDKGWIAISQHGYRGQKWKRNEYVARWPGRDLTGTAAMSGDGDHDDEGGGIAPPPSGAHEVVETPPEGGGNGSLKVVEQLHQDKRLSNNFPENLPEREGASADPGDRESEPWQPSRPLKAGPLRADTIRRVQRFVSGEGYGEGEWPKWSSSTIGHIAKEFAKLSDSEQEAACRWRDPFLEKCRLDGVKKPMPVANYFRDRVWEMLIGPSRPGRKPERIPMAPFGPVWAGKRALHLLDGPVAVDIPLDVRAAVEATWARLCQGSEAAAASYLRRKGITVENGRLVFPDGFETAEQRRRTLEQGYPEVNGLHEQAKRHETTVTEACYGRLADLCEPVPVDGPVMAAWIAHEDRMGWPSVPDPGRMRVVYYPKGGPDGLKDFERAARAAMAGTRSEAAE